MIVQNASFHPYSLFNYVGDPERCERGKAFVQKHIASGYLKPIIDKTYPMEGYICLLYTSPSPRDKRQSRMPSSA